MDRSGSSSLVGEAARYLEDTAPNHGGRNTRPLAIPVLATSYCSGARSGTGAAVAALGVLAGVAAWFGFSQLEQPDPSIVLAVVCFVLTAGLLVAATLLGLRLLRSGRELVRALRRWYEVAPEVPVRGAEVFTEQPGLARIVLAGLAVLTGAGSVAVGTVLGGPPVWFGAGIAAAGLLATGVLAARGWWQVRALLRPAAPQPSQEAFAPAPYAQPGAPMPPHGGYAQPAPALRPATPPPQQWAPPPPPAPAAPTPQPWLPAGVQPGGETWQPDAEPDIGHTRLVADTTMSGRSDRSRRRCAVVLDDGRRLTPGVTTLIGRTPVAREDDHDVETLAVLHPTVSKTHAAIRVTDSAVYVTDRASTNGTTAVDPSGTRRKLPAWTETQVETGSQILLGSFRVTVIAAD